VSGFLVRFSLSGFLLARFAKDCWGLMGVRFSSFWGIDGCPVFFDIKDCWELMGVRFSGETASAKLCFWAFLD